MKARQAMRSLGLSGVGGDSVWWSHRSARNSPPFLHNATQPGQGFPIAWCLAGLKVERSFWTPLSTWILCSGLNIYLFASAGLASLPTLGCSGEQKCFIQPPGQCFSVSLSSKPNPRCWHWDKLRNTNNSNAGWIGLCSPDQDPTVKCVYTNIPVHTPQDRGREKFEQVQQSVVTVLMGEK